MKYTATELIEKIERNLITEEIVLEVIIDLEEVCKTCEICEIEKYGSYIHALSYFYNSSSILPFYSRTLDLLYNFLKRAESNDFKSEIYYALMVMYYKKGHTLKIIENGLKYEEIMGNNGIRSISVFNILSIILNYYGFYEKSYEYIQKYIELEKVDKRLDQMMLKIVEYNNYCYVLLKLHRIDEAEEYLNKLLQLVKDNPENVYVQKFKDGIDITTLYVKLYSSNDIIAKKTMEQYIKIMYDIMEYDNISHIRNDSFEPHLFILKVLYEHKYIEETIKIATYILEHGNYVGNRCELYQFIIKIINDNQNCLPKENQEKLFNDYLKCLEDYHNKNEEIISMLISEQFKIMEVNQKYDIIKKKYETDDLTKCYNRPSLEIHGEEFLKNNKIGSVVFVDLDNLKKINDQYDHSYGDFVLKELTKRIKDRLPNEAYLYRYAGDEFIILMPFNACNTEAIMNEITECFKTPIEYMNTALKISFSWGVVEFDGTSKDLNNLIKEADINMYKYKKSKKTKKSY